MSPRNTPARKPRLAKVSCHSCSVRRYPMISTTVWPGHTLRTSTVSTRGSMIFGRSYSTTPQPSSEVML